MEMIRGILWDICALPLYSILPNWLWHVLAKPPGVMQGSCLLKAFREGQRSCHWGSRMGQKPLGCHRAWRERTVAKANETRGAMAVCAKDQRCVFRRAQALVRALSVRWHVKEIPVEAIFQFPQNNCMRQQGVGGVPSIGQRSCQSWRGVRTVVRTQTEVQWLFGNPNSHAYTHWRNAWQIKVQQEKEKQQITLKWCPLGVSDKGCY